MKKYLGYFFAGSAIYFAFAGLGMIVIASLTITLLVLFIMLSGHSSFVWSSKYNWLILSMLAIIFSSIQYYVNYKNKKESN